MKTECSHPEHTPRHDDGIEEVSERYVRVRHPIAGWSRMMDGACVWEVAKCDEWINEVSGVRPCHVCRPGPYAVWRANLWGANYGRWELDNKARAVFRRAAGRWPTWRNSRGEVMRNRPMPGDEEALADLERYPQYQ